MSEFARTPVPARRGVLGALAALSVCAAGVAAERPAPRRLPPLETAPPASATPAPPIIYTSASGGDRVRGADVVSDAADVEDAHRGSFWSWTPLRGARDDNSVARGKVVFVARTDDLAMAGDLQESDGTDAAATADPAAPAPYVPGAIYGSDGCCGVCDDCCYAPHCCVPTFWVGGVEATFLAPDINTGAVGYRVQDTLSAPPVDVSFGSGDADLDDLYMSPRLWLGVQHGCWGIVTRYWHMRANEAAYDPFVFAPGGYEGYVDIGYSAYNQLDAYTIDLEGTYSFCCCDAKNTFAFGVRYALADHVTGLDSIADVDDGAGGTGTVIGRARAAQLARGTGITGGWVCRKPLFCCSCIHLIGGLRGSVLWGCSHVSAETGVAEQTPSGPAGAISTNSASAEVADSLFIGEAIGGLQWDYRVQCFPADAFFRIVAEYQYWDMGGGTAAANSFAGFGGGASFSQGTAAAAANGLQMDLYGFSIGTGFTW